MRLLITNDDGVEAPGLRALAAALSGTYDITVVAPAREQSGIGHAFTFQSPLHYRPSSTWDGLEAYAVEGTPSDCVKFAVSHLLQQRPAVVVSGINVGENSGISSIYSGTVAAAREGALWGIPSFAFSIAGSDPGHIGGYAAHAARVLRWVLSCDGGALVSANPRTFFNVNFPACGPEECRGVLLTRQSLAFFDDHYRKAGDNGHGDGYLLFGEKQDLEGSRDYDSRALLEEYATLTPLGLDATDHDVLSRLRMTGEPRIEIPGPEAGATEQ